MVFNYLFIECIYFTVLLPGITYKFKISGVVHASMHFSASKVYINANIDEISKLKERFVFAPYICTCLLLHKIIIRFKLIWFFDILPWAFYLDRITGDDSFGCHESTVPCTSDEFDALDVKSLEDVLHLKAFPPFYLMFFVSLLLSFI